MNRHLRALVLLLALALPWAVAAREPVISTPTGIPGVDAAQLRPDYWIAHAPDADHVILNRAQIAAENRALIAQDPSVRDIETLPASLDGTQVRSWIQALSIKPAAPLYDAAGRRIGDSTVAGWMQSLALDAIPATQPVRYALVVRRTPLRTFPTLQRVFNEAGDTDIDRFQESAFFPGTPVAVVHDSRDGQWAFVVGDLYAAWVRKEDIAVGDKTAVFAYVHSLPYVVVTGASVRTGVAPDEPRVSGLQLDMGMRYPWHRNWPGAKAVNGQAAYTSYVIDLPVRNADGSLGIAQALVPRTADISPDYLPLTRANILRQAFKYLGERYGWGHSFGTRDCSGFVSEVYRSFGVVLPRNTRDQSISPALNRVAVPPMAGRVRRNGLLRDVQVGDLVYIPGHVMMVIGGDAGAPYVIHDTNGGAWLDDQRQLVHGKLNGVSVTPLAILHSSQRQTYIDRITNIQRIRP